MILLATILTLVALGILSAVILYLVARRFHVYEDPRIDEVETCLPGVNCGGCGYAGCRALAEALVREEDISALYCPVGGNDTMKTIAALLSKATPQKEPRVAVVRCGGSREKRVHTNIWDGARSCAAQAALYVGQTGCVYGCLGQGDCVTVCAFDAIHIDPATELPRVDEVKCTACGACVGACPKAIIELRGKGPKGYRVWVNCVSRDPGAVSRKACGVSCIACGKCVKACPFEAIALRDNLAYIDSSKCRLCRKCAPECPTGAILEVNFPARKPAEVAPNRK